MVLAHEADAGIAFDGDGDRLGAVASRPAPRHRSRASPAPEPRLAIRQKPS